MVAYDWHRMTPYCSVVTLVIIFIHHIMVAATQQKAIKRKGRKDTVNTMNSYSITQDTPTHY